MRVNYLRVGYLSVFTLFLLAGTGLADKNKVVPEAEMLASKSSKTKGIESVRKLGVVALDGEFLTPKGRFLRVCEIEILPGGVVAMHKHKERPGVAYILQGELMEYRGGKARVKKQGDTAFEKTGVIHWWENKSKKVTAKALVVDIVPAETR